MIRRWAAAVGSWFVGGVGRGSGGVVKERQLAGGDLFLALAAGGVLLTVGGSLRGVISVVASLA